MARNKPRIQLALYARPKHPGTYHYALFIAPKDARGSMETTKHHVKNTLQIIEGQAAQPWRYESAIVEDVDQESRLLVRIIVAKLTASREEAYKVLETVPIYQVDDAEKAEAKTFTCRTWVRDALQQLADGKMVSGLGSWEVTERKAMEYIHLKRQQGRWSADSTKRPDVPLLDLLDGEKELVA